ncbi:FO synthase subunit 1, partial [Durusdinium trenchii]
MPPKRKSKGGSDAGSQAKSAKIHHDFPHVAKMTDWLSKKVFSEGGPDTYLNKIYNTEDAWDHVGWKRSVMLLLCLHAVKELQLEAEISHMVKASFGTIYATLSAFTDVKAQVHANRGMSRYLSHEIVGKDLLNAAYSSGINGLEEWKDQLRNSEELVMLFIKRLESDHDATPPPMRKAFTFAQGLAKLQVCGAFLHFLSQLQKLSPPAAFEEAEKSLRTQFMLGYMDPDLSHVLESQFPPGDVSSIAAFRPFVAGAEKIQQNDREEKAAELERQYRQADLKLLMERKGTTCANAMIEGLLAGLQLGDTDRIYWVDVLPNEFVEFGRACIERAWSPDSRKVLYVGFVNKDQKVRATKAFRDYVYQKWDGMAGAPPKSRPPDEEVATKTPDLQVLAFQNGSPVWPQPLSARFKEGTEEHQALLKKKCEFDQAFPQASAQTASGRTPTPGRAGGDCDYSVDGGARPLDISRELSLAVVGQSDFETELLTMCEGKGGKPSILIASNLDIWLGNPSDEDANFSAQELFGFGLGAFEEKEIRDVQAENAVLPFRLGNDLDFVAYQKKPQALCEFLRWLAISKGLSDVKLEDHDAGESDPVPVTFRYVVKPKDSMICHVFRPKVPEPAADIKT